MLSSDRADHSWSLAISTSGDSTEVSRLVMRSRRILRVEEWARTACTLYGGILKSNWLPEQNSCAIVSDRISLIQNGLRITGQPLHVWRRGARATAPCHDPVRTRSSMAH